MSKEPSKVTLPEDELFAEFVVLEGSEGEPVLAVRRYYWAKPQRTALVSRTSDGSMQICHMLSEAGARNLEGALRRGTACPAPRPKAHTPEGKVTAWEKGLPDKRTEET